MTTNREAAGRGPGAPVRGLRPTLLDPAAGSNSESPEKREVRRRRRTPTELWNVFSPGSNLRHSAVGSVPDPKVESFGSAPGSQALKRPIWSRYVRPGSARLSLLYSSSDAICVSAAAVRHLRLPGGAFKIKVCAS